MRPEQENAKIAEGRGKVYYWLADFFLTRPTHEGLRQALGTPLLQALGEVFSGEDDSVRWLTQLAEGLEPTSAEKIGQEHDGLFSAPVPGRYVPPYESCFTDRAYSANALGFGEMWGRTTTKVGEFYARNNFETKAVEIPPDHIGLELLFMHKLCEREAQALLHGEKDVAEQVRRKELEFLKKHLCLWLPSLFESISNATEKGFYFHVSRLAQEFAEQDAEYLTDAVSA